MFNQLYTLIYSNSDAVSYLTANPFTAEVCVMFKDGNRYVYNNVSRRAILNLITQPNMSLGFWVNDNCVKPSRAVVVHKMSLGFAL